MLLPVALADGFLPQVPVHIEMSFRDSPPATQLFYAQQVEQWKGGETPLSFGRFHGFHGASRKAKGAMAIFIHIP